MHRLGVKRILIVDDEEQYCDVVSQMVLMKGYSCDTASSVSEAMAKLREDRFDLVVSDIRMKGRDGLQLMKEARKEHPHLDFIVMTGYASDYTYTDIVDAGASDFIIKPFSARELEAKIGRIEKERRVLSNLIDTNRSLLREISLNMSVAELSKSLLLPAPMNDLSGLVLGHAKLLTESSIGHIDYTSLDKKDLMVPDFKDEEWSDHDCADKNVVLESLRDLWNSVVKNPKPVIMNSVEGSEDCGYRFLIVPVLTDEVLRGILALGRSGHDYSEQDLVFGGRLAFIYGLAIQRKCAEEKLSQAYGQLMGAFEETVDALTSALEMRDPYTVGHQKKVADLASHMAREMRCTADVVDTVRLAGLVHDIGKIAVPSEILTKMSNLKTIEMTLIRQHPNAGYDILKGVKFPWPIAETVLQHHERMDGSGYPLGLSGDDILLEARILAVADVAEAMSSHRPYRAALGTDKAIEEILKNRGTLYDPQSADACLKLLIEKGYRLQ